MTEHDAGGSPESRETSAFDLTIAYQFGSIFSRESRARSATQSERLKFEFKDGLMLLVEMSLAYCWMIILQRSDRQSGAGKLADLIWASINKFQRRMTQTDLINRNVTLNQELINLYFWRGTSAFGAMFAGYLADTYTGIYSIAMVNVVLHFAISSLLMIEELIKVNDFDSYPAAMSTAVLISFVPLKATDFARLVYGLQQLYMKNKATVTLFIFLSLWMHERTGGILLCIVGSLKLSWRNQVLVSFAVCGLSFFLYCFILKPSPIHSQPHLLGQRIGNEILGCIVSAIWTKRQLHGAFKKNSWVDFAEHQYSMKTITLTKQFLRLCLCLLPSMGFLMFAVSRGDFYLRFWKRLKPTGFFAYTSLRPGIRIVTVSSVLLFQFVVLPLLELIGLKKKFMVRFILGYMAALFVVFYTAVMMKKIELPEPGGGVGIVRISNAQEIPVYVSTQDFNFTSINSTIAGFASLTLSFDISQESLFKLMIRVDSESYLTTHFSAIPGRTTAYLIVRPLNVIRVRDDLPLIEGPPGMNDMSKATVFVVNLINQLNTTIHFTGMEMQSHEKKFIVKANCGNLVTTQVDEGEYSIIIPDIMAVYREIFFGIGGVYGVYLFQYDYNYVIWVDAVIPANTLRAESTLGINIPYAIAIALCYVSLRSFLFTNAPEGLESISFAYFEFLENITCWIVWINFRLWHNIITAQVLFIYSMVYTFFFFFSIFALVKYIEFFKS